jgi:dTDP-4-amino-4,6-dideoxygalactose transaminase
MEMLDQKIRGKRMLAEQYRQFFSGSTWEAAGYSLILERPNTRANYWLNVLLCPDRSARDEMLAYTHENKVMTRPAWELMYRLAPHRPSVRSDCPVAERVVEKIVCLPSSALPTRNETLA